MVRGRDAGCPAPPAQIRTCALTHTAPTSGSDRGPLDRRIRSAAWYTELRHCVRSVLRPRDSRWSRALAPPAPQRLAPPCSPVSQLLCPCQTSSGRSSSAYGLAPSRCGPSRNRDNPKTSQVPAYDLRACIEFFDAVEPDQVSPYRPARCCLRPSTGSRLSKCDPLRRSIAPPSRTAADASPAPSRVPTHGLRRNVDRLLLRFGGLAPPVICQLAWRTLKKILPSALVESI